MSRVSDRSANRGGSRPWTLAGKELKMYLRDTQALFFSLALPLVLVLLMVATFGGQTQFNAKAYVVNLDRGPAGAEFTRRLDEVPEITVELLDQATAERRLADSNILNFIVIASDFSARLDSGRAPALTIRQRGTGGTEGQVVNSYAVGLAHTLAGERLTAGQAGEILASIGRPVNRAAVEAKVQALYREAEAEPVLTVTEQAVGGRPEAVAIFLPGLVTMFTAFSLSLTAVVLVEERKKGTLERLMTTRLSRGELLAGTWLGTFGRGLVQILFLFGLALVFFRIFTPASFAGVLAFGVISVAAVSGLGLVIASIARTPEQANWMAVFSTMIMTVLGGSFFGTAEATGLLGTLTRFTYNFWANDGFRRIILKAESLASPAILKDIAVLAGIGVVSWAIALALFRLRGDDK